MTVRELLDPTAERAPSLRARTPRPTALEGLTVALLDINKARGDIFLDRIADHLTARGLRVERYVKPTFTKPVPPGLGGEIAARADAVIEALAD